MSTATIQTAAGFNTNDFWVANTGASTNETFVGLTSSTTSVLPAVTTNHYSEFDFIHNGLLYRYVGDWQVRAQSGLLVGTITAGGAYNQVIVESAGTVVATYAGPSRSVDFGSFSGAGVLNIVGNLVQGVVDLLFGGSNGVRSFANLHLDATPTLPALAFADGATLTGAGGGDALTGGGSTDLLVGGGGNDALNGAGGVDTAVYAGPRSAYVITQATVNGTLVTTVTGGSEGTDTLTNIENIRFGGVNGVTLTLAQALDTTPPAVTVTSAGGLTNQAVQTIAGNVGIADAGATVRLYEGGQIVASGVVQANGTFAVTTTLNGDGAHTLEARVTDASGNTGAGTPVAFTLDRVADAGVPVTLAVNPTADGVITAAEAGAVAFTVAGLDADATAAITFTDGTHVATATATADGTYTVDLSGLNGTVTSAVLVTDAAGNIVSRAGNLVTLNIVPIVPDTIPPVVAVTSVGGLTNQPVQTITGSVGVADAGATVGLYEGGQLVASGVVRADGTFSVSATLAGDGTHTLEARVTDAAGNIGTSGPLTYLLDTVADAGAPVTVAVNPTADGVITAAEATAVAFTVAGLDAGATAAITFTDGAHVATATAGADGAYTVDLSGLNGTVTSAVLVTDAAGNTVARSGNSVTLATAPPPPDTTPPVVTVTSTGGLTNDPTPTVTGTTGLAEAGATVGLYEGGVLIGTDIVRADGTFSVTGTLTGDGTHTLEARITDAAGNTGTSGPLTFVLDTVADAGAPVTVVVNATADGVIDASEATAVGFTVAGLDAGATAAITFTDGTRFATATETADGTYTVDLSGLNGTVTSAVLVTDAAGNTLVTTGNTVTLDTAPVVPDTTPPVVAVTSTGGLTNDATPTIAGNVGLADAGSTVGLYEGSVLVGTDIVRADGTFSVTGTLTGDGTHTLEARVTDAAGNVGSSNPITVILDRVADAGAPVTLAVNPTADGVITAAEAATVGFTVTGLDADATSAITFTDGTHVAMATAAADGTYTVNLSALNGIVTSTVVVTDAAGNSLTRSGNAVVLDTVVPIDTTPPTVTVTSAGGLTNQPVQAIAGSVGAADAGATVGVYEGGQLVASGLVQPNGTFAVTATLAGDGQHTFEVRVTDAAGNTGVGTPITFTLDRVADEGAQTAVSVNATADGVIDASEAAAVGFIVTGLDAGATAAITFTDGTHVATATAAANGTYAVDLSGLNGTVTSAVLVTDAAGNTAATAGNTVTLDTAPIVPDTTPPVVTVTSSGGLTDDPTQTITGSVGLADAGAAVGLYEGGQLVASGLVRADGTFAVTATLAGDGPHTLEARVTDAAGNTGTSGPIAFTLDTRADTGAPVTVAVNPTADGVITAAEAGAVAFTVAGLDADATAAITFTDGTHVATATATADGTYTVDLSGLNGTVTSAVLVTDAAGNSLVTAGNAVTLNTAPPVPDTTPPVVTVTSSGGLTNDPTPTITGTTGLAEAGATVRLYEGGVLVGADVVRADGTFTVTATLAGDGTHTLEARITDAAGNTGASGPLTFVLDRVADAGAPVTVAVNPTADGIITAAEAAAVGFTVAGLDPDATAAITFTDGARVATATAGADGTYTVDLSGLNGTVTSAVLVTDAAGNTIATAGNAVTLNTVPPGPDTTPPVVTMTSTGGLTNNPTQTIAGGVGAADAGASVGIYEGGQLVASGVVQADGSFAVATALSGDGSHTLEARVTDAAGNTGTGTPVTFTLDTAADAGAPVTVTVDPTADGVITAAEARAVAFTLAGLDPDARAAITFSDGTHTVGATETADGAYTVDLSGLNGTVTSAVLVTDAAGNTHATSGNTVALRTATTPPDTTPPAPPTGTGIDGGSDSGTPGDGVTNDGTPTITGRTEPNATVDLYDGSTLVGSGRADGTGAFHVTPTDPLGDGDHTLMLRISDASGNTAAPMMMRVTIDGQAPDARPDFAAGAGFAVQLKGNLLANDSDATALHLDSVRFVDSLVHKVPASGTEVILGDHGLLTVGSDGSYSYRPTSAGHDEFTYTVVDAAGNASQAKLSIDVAPTVPPSSLSFGFALTDAKFDFSDGHALMTGPDGQVVDLTGVGTINFRDGTVQQSDANALVDDLYYYTHNADVWAAHNSFGLDAEQHYAQYGWREGRDPNALFSTKDYLAANPDVAAAAQAIGLNPVDHYLQYGWHEGRSPGGGFSAEAYLAINPDVAAAAAQGGLDPLSHYLRYGEAEGRAAFPGRGVGADGHVLYGDFDATAYLARNPDVSAAVPSGVDPSSFAFTHYLSYGAKEGRDPNALFSTQGYLAANPDVAAAGGNPLLHYEQYGWREGHDPGPAFSTNAYLAAHPDVLDARVDPLQHFLTVGGADGRHTG